MARSLLPPASPSGEARRGGLLLLDGYSLLFRAFFALQHLSNRLGDPTNALFGFFRMVAAVYTQVQPEYVAVALDHPGPTFRDQLFPGYKGTRRETPTELKEQLEAVRGLLDAARIGWIDHEGLEADDLIATLATRARSEGVRSLVVTGDRDGLQLVEDPWVTILLTRKGVSDLTWMDEAGVVERYGVKSSQYADFAVLRGDKSDNLPGVPGIGEKTGAELIRNYGSLEGVLDGVESLPLRLRQAISERVEELRLAKQLTELRRDAEIGVGLEHFRVGTWDPVAAERVFVETYDLRSPFDALKRAFSARGQITAAGSLPSRPKVPVEPLAQCAFADLLEASGDLYVYASYDGEPGRSRVSRLAIGNGKCWCSVAPAEIADVAGRIGTRALVGLDLKLLIRSLALLHGVQLRAQRFVDLGVLAYLVDPSLGRINLAGLVAAVIGTSPPPDGEGEPGLFDGGIEGDEATQLLQLAELKVELLERLNKDGIEELAWSVEVPLVRVLAEMEIIGVKVDRRRLDEIGADLASEAAVAQRQLYHLAGEEFNPNSPKQLADVLFNRLRLAGSKRTKSGYSTDASVLEGLRDAHPIVPVLLRYRELEKLRSTFYEGLRAEVSEDGRIHASYNQTVARTGRISSERPNLQNIPVRSEEGRRFREVFVAPEGRVLISADYSQIELRVLAHLSGDEALLAALQSDEDIHRSVAARVFKVPPEQVSYEQRSVAKMVAYGLSYGMEAYGLSQRLGVSPADADVILDAFFKAFPGLLSYRRIAVDEARRLGYTATLLGRRRYIPELNSSNRSVRLSAERQAMNAATQGLAADIFKIALVELRERLEPLSALLVLQVHDEVVVEAPADRTEEAKAVVVSAMTGAYTLSVPLVVNVGVGPTWASAK